MVPNPVARPPMPQQPAQPMGAAPQPQMPMARPGMPPQGAPPAMATGAMGMPPPNAAGGGQVASLNAPPAMMQQSALANVLRGRQGGLQPISQGFSTQRPMGRAY